ncbi:unnamed protein product [Rotaria sp. Silwood2]|nr:unnamed protein product [Rotaria sp. Silwood2]CAF4503403.1 unnamed protein product [Rotaria sp. Silwood2]CAF4605842.1 unnamed protein product [Rotaria sp. Silwood2]
MDNETKEEKKAYSYVQRWQSVPISSYHYVEASSHVNPQRNPYSSKTITLPQAKIGKVILNQGLIEQLHSFRKINDTYDMLFESASKYARAYNQYQFEYIGNGYFYSQYEKIILNSRSTVNELQTKEKITGKKNV